LDKQTLNQVWDQMRQKYGIYLRVLEAIPEDRYQGKVVPGMRTPAELVAHLSGTIVRDVAQGVAKGEITADESLEAKVASGWATKADAISFAKSCWSQANAAVAATGDPQLNAMVPTPWHMTIPGWVGFNILNDEFLHHRGQLYAYARLCGAEPPFMWGFEENASGFRPSE
jgi:DinB superfamily